MNINNGKMYHVVERKFDNDGHSEDTARYLTLEGWSCSSRSGLTFSRSDAMEVRDTCSNKLRSYNAEYFIGPAAGINLQCNDIVRTRLVPSRSNNIAFIDCHLIASFIVDLRDPSAYEIVDRTYVAINGAVESDSYYSECVYNAELTDILETVHGKLLDSAIVNGVFRMVYTVTCSGGAYTTQDGVEYDTWETYNLLTKTELSEDEFNAVHRNLQESLLDF